MMSGRRRGRPQTSTGTRGGAGLRNGFDATGMIHVVTNPGLRTPAAVQDIRGAPPKPWLGPPSPMSTSSSFSPSSAGLNNSYSRGTKGRSSTGRLGSEGGYPRLSSAGSRPRTAGPTAGGRIRSAGPPSSSGSSGRRSRSPSRLLTTATLTDIVSRRNPGLQLSDIGVRSNVMQGVLAHGCSKVEQPRTYLRKMCIKPLALRGEHRVHAKV